MKIIPASLQNILWTDLGLVQTAAVDMHRSIRWSTLNGDVFYAGFRQITSPLGA
jgi:hypothetical protein